MRLYCLVQLFIEQELSDLVSALMIFQDQRGQANNHVKFWCNPLSVLSVVELVLMNPLGQCIWVSGTRGLLKSKMKIRWLQCVTW